MSINETLMIKPCDWKYPSCLQTIKRLLQVPKRPNNWNDGPSDHSPVSSQVLSIQKIAETV